MDEDTVIYSGSPLHEHLKSIGLSDDEITPVEKAFDDKETNATESSFFIKIFGVIEKCFTTITTLVKSLFRNDKAEHNLKLALIKEAIDSGFINRDHQVALECFSPDFFSTKYSNHDTNKFDNPLKLFGEKISTLCKHLTWAFIVVIIAIYTSTVVKPKDNDAYSAPTYLFTFLTCSIFAFSIIRIKLSRLPTDTIDNFKIFLKHLQEINKTYNIALEFLFDYYLITFKNFKIPRRDSKNSNGDVHFANLRLQRAVNSLFISTSKYLEILHTTITKSNSLDIIVVPENLFYVEDLSSETTSCYYMLKAQKQDFDLQTSLVISDTIFHFKNLSNFKKYFSPINYEIHLKEPCTNLMNNIKFEENFWTVDEDSRNKSFNNHEMLLSAKSRMRSCMKDGLSIIFSLDKNGENQLDYDATKNKLDAIAFSLEQTKFWLDEAKKKLDEEFKVEKELYQVSNTKQEIQENAVEEEMQIGATIEHLIEDEYFEDIGLNDQDKENGTEKKGSLNDQQSKTHMKELKEKLIYVRKVCKGREKKALKKRKFETSFSTSSSDNDTDSIDEPVEKSIEDLDNNVKNESTRPQFVDAKMFFRCIPNTEDDQKQLPTPDHAVLQNVLTAHRFIRQDYHEDVFGEDD